VEGATRRRTGGFFFSGQFSAVRFKANRETGHDAIGGADPRGARASARGDGPSGTEAFARVAHSEARRRRERDRTLLGGGARAQGRTLATGGGSGAEGSRRSDARGGHLDDRTRGECVCGFGTEGGPTTTLSVCRRYARATKSARPCRSKCPRAGRRALRRVDLDEPDKKRPGDGKNSSRRPGVGQMSGAPFRRSRNRRFADVRLRVSSTRLFLGAGSSCAALRATPPGCLPR